MGRAGPIVVHRVLRAAAPLVGSVPGGVDLGDPPGRARVPGDRTGLRYPMVRAVRDRGLGGPDRGLGEPRPPAGPDRKGREDRVDRVVARGREAVVARVVAREPAPARACRLAGGAPRVANPARMADPVASEAARAPSPRRTGPLAMTAGAGSAGAGNWSQCHRPFQHRSPPGTPDQEPPGSPKRRSGLIACAPGSWAQLPGFCPGSPWV